MKIDRTILATRVILGALIVGVIAWEGDCTAQEVLTEHFLPAEGYSLDSLNDIAFSAGLETLECPSTNVISTRYKCNVKGSWVDCTRNHCCKDYTYIAGRCVHRDEDPCSMNLCEQQCTVYLQRIICTCFYGYKFSPENQKTGTKPLCLDINECLESNGDCEHECINELGTYRCTCNEGFKLREDNRTCESDYPSPGELEQPAFKDRCYANCDTVIRLHEKLRSLQEKVSTLNTAVRLSSFSSGPPGPSGPPGSPGSPGPRGFPGAEGIIETPMNGHDYTYSVLDAFVPLPGDETTQCRCKRGAHGEPGAQGTRGPKGETGERGPRGTKGETGSFDFLLLLLADVRHDIVHLQNRVYINGEKPPKFDFESALEKRRLKEKHRLLKQQQLLHAYLPSTAETVTIEADSATTTEVFEEDREGSLYNELTADFHDLKVQLPNLNDYLEEFDYDPGSGEMTDEDYL